MYKKVLCAVDGSDHSLRAASTAGQLAAGLGSKLVFLTVTKEIKATNPVREYMKLEQLTGEPQYVLDAAVERIMERATKEAKEAGVADVRTEVRVGPPARTIAQVASEIEADALVLGSRGLGDFEGLLLGSVSHKVTALAPCTCILVK